MKIYEVSILDTITKDESIKWFYAESVSNLIERLENEFNIAEPIDQIEIINSHDIGDEDIESIETNYTIH